MPKGIKGFQKGFKHTPEDIESIRKKLRIRNIGSGNSNWKGGIWKYGSGLTKSLKNEVRKRDEFICKLCGIEQNKYGKTKQLDVHHINYDKENNDINNLITLCRKCHKEVHKERDYEKECYWIDCFENILDNIY